MRQTTTMTTITIISNGWKKNEWQEMSLDSNEKETRKKTLNQNKNYLIELTNKRTDLVYSGTCLKEFKIGIRMKENEMKQSFRTFIVCVCIFILWTLAIFFLCCCYCCCSGFDDDETNDYYVCIPIIII